MRKLFLIGLLACAFAGNPNSADAKAPNLLSYQGSIKATSGAAINQNMNVTYRIYNQENGGTAVWSETNAVEIKNGLFNTYLGTKSELNINFSEELWLEVVLENGEVMPRTRLAANPYSFQAGIASFADTSDVAKTVVDGVLTWEKFTPDAKKAGGILLGTYPNPTLNSDAIPQYGIPGEKIAKGSYTHFSAAPAGPALGDMEGSTFPYIYIAPNKIANRHLQVGAVKAGNISAEGVAVDQVLVSDGLGNTKWAAPVDPRIPVIVPPAPGTPLAPSRVLKTDPATGKMVEGIIEDNGTKVTVNGAMEVTGALNAGKLIMKTLAVDTDASFTLAFDAGVALYKIIAGGDYTIPTVYANGDAVEEGRIVYVTVVAPAASANINFNPIMQGDAAMYVFVAGNWIKL